MRETVEAILETYGTKRPQWLSDLTHKETPWIEARAGLGEGERGNREISQQSMYAYYSAL